MASSLTYIADVVPIIHVFSLILCPMWAAQGPSLVSWSRSKPFVHLHCCRSIAHGLLAWPSPSLVEHLGAPNTYTFTRQEICRTTHSTWHLWLAISKIKRIWKWTQPGKPSILSILVSIIHHIWMNQGTSWVGLSVISSLWPQIINFNIQNKEFLIKRTIRVRGLNLVWGKKLKEQIK